MGGQRGPPPHRARPRAGVLLAGTAFLIHQTITDPTGTSWNITIDGESHDSWPTWVPWLAWIGVSVWLLIAVGVLLLRLSVLRDLHSENAWIYEHGVAHSIHRASVDHDDGEAGWATYIALDHRLDDHHAARIHDAFEQWLSPARMPPSGSGPLSSATLFGPQAAGGYFLVRLPVSTIAGDTTEHRWMLVTAPRDGEGDVIVTPVPVPKKLTRIRATLRRKAARRSRHEARTESARRVREQASEDHLPQTVSATPAGSIRRTGPRARAPSPRYGRRSPCGMRIV
ncbi:hypothetical protein FHR81_003424 [Actinoalloteichus hoggarensis]|uniref:Uncharacterized protein n=1 Tax=Actinoalloteichus hoggarensis TaxID=1470176 RepID=A0A221W7C4_9PSEU|nr:hypothetical protein [Actinoalloteichus hoggarensis]ASO21775.1 hypothetical protein AHOG_20790 [Actinoalloteichus hoggarensis]MBB5922372.1 hypothetical protein [Actinoalloteichus hoggarensis]